jgi:DNA mismatch endonuclease (patch repair protein)
MPGKPDLAFGVAKLAVFVDGAFWHGHPSKYWEGRSGPYWDRKISGNIERDRRVDAQLANLGWKVLRLWDFEIAESVEACAIRVLDEIAPSHSAAQLAESLRTD